MTLILGEASQPDRKGVEGHNRNGGRPESHRRASSGVTHPGRKLAEEARPLLDKQNLICPALRALRDPQPPAVERMPEICDAREAQTVSRMMFGVLDCSKCSGTMDRACACSRSGWNEAVLSDHRPFLGTTRIGR